MSMEQKTEAIWETVFLVPRRSFNSTMERFTTEACVDAYRRFVAPFSPRTGPFARVNRAVHAVTVQATASCGFNPRKFSILRELHERAGRA